MQLQDIQKRLAELGHDPGPIDGDWGDKTMKAVAAAIGVKPPVLETTEDPPWLSFARAQLSTHEVPGSGNSPSVLSYFADALHPEVKQDAVPWCAAFVGAMLARAGIKPSGSLMARSYLDWGVPLDKPRLGCIVVFKRGSPPSGHVAFYTGGNVEVLGGNQGDAVTTAKFRRDSVLGFRWPKDFN